jgi:hypothetical protein
MPSVQVAASFFSSGFCFPAEIFVVLVSGQHIVCRECNTVATIVETLSTIGASHLAEAENQIKSTPLLPLASTELSPLRILCEECDVADHEGAVQFCALSTEK